MSNRKKNSSLGCSSPHRQYGFVKKVRDIALSHLPLGSKVNFKANVTGRHERGRVTRTCDKRRQLMYSEDGTSLSLQMMLFFSFFFSFAIPFLQSYSATISRPFKTFIFFIMNKVFQNFKISVRVFFYLFLLSLPHGCIPLSASS